jgi:hypothetical protein
MMMVEKITSATEKVASLIDSGVEINQAVLRAAGGLPREAIKRVVENINVHNCLALFKSGEDRTKEFPLADSEVVFQQLGTGHVKQSYLLNKRDGIPDNSFYTVEVTPDKRKGHGYTPRTFLTKEARANNFVKKADLLQKKAELIEDMYTRLGEMARTSFRKIASHIKVSPKATGILASVLYDKYGADSLDSIVFLAKHAGLTEMKNLGIDHTRFDDNSLFKHACHFVESIGGMGKLAKTSSWEWFIRENEPPSSKKPSESKAKEKWEGDKWKREEAKYTKGLLDEAKKETAEGRKYYTEALKGIGSAINFGGLAGVTMLPIRAMLAGAVKARGSQLPKFGDVEKPDFSENAILALKYKRNFEDLIRNDEILKEKDPKELANYFQTMIRMAPHLAADQEILRAHLRQVSGQALMGPYDAKVLADLEETLHPTRRKK